ncbi:LysM peptidoglycan-binding domain-containing protein [Imhoffiella purpurea]|uniref:Membrane-bound lytic murein transglycosylase D n=1 Tax=Imhoffiella purpurea TaxID=1249627 RepID=W9VBQ2_9GAMM|nr:transglycosylase SLT domain-containing protein [Imhoffiella purpurea]EXJ14396.1 Membrane-bound lytic murein transglycosylase D precursor [Imhoffiella purpurea]
MRTVNYYLRTSGLTLALLAMSFLAGCAGSGGEREVGQSHVDYGDSGTFPVPDALQDNVDFWRHVYGMWSRGEVAIHDSDHLGVVYEVATLPGPIQASYTSAQRAYLEARTHYHADRLRALEQRLRSGQTPTAADRDLVAKFERAGGIGTLYGASERIRLQRGLRERFRRGVEISGRYDKIFREIMRSHGVPEDLAYLPHVESSFQTNARSSVGAGGVWQFMPATGRIYMTVNDSVDERYDPILAADGAARYLAQAYGKLGSWPLAITSYNHGQGGMAKAKAQYGTDIGRIVSNYDGPYFGFASRNFYAEFVAAREVASHPSRYFPEGVRYESPWPHDRLILASSMPADHIARHYGTSSRVLADLNMHWRNSLRNGARHIPVGTTVWLPHGSKQRAGSPPPPISTMIARTEPRQKPSTVSRKAVARVEKPRSTDSQKRVAAKTAPKSKTKGKTTKVRYHVVKPQETLYRVALQNGISVAELRKLNKMKPNDNHIQPGQRLKVGI